jgi:hypothetical protein
MGRHIAILGALDDGAEKPAFRVPEGQRGVQIDPCLARHVDGPNPPLRRQLPDGVRKPVPSLGQLPPDGLKQDRRAVEDARVGGVPVGQVLSDPCHMAVRQLHLRHILDVEQAPPVRVHRQADLSLQGRCRQDLLQQRRLDQMVRHGQQEWITPDRQGRGQCAGSVSKLPIRGDDEPDLATTSRGQLEDVLADLFGPVAQHHQETPDPGRLAREDDPLGERQAEHGQRRLRAAVAHGSHSGSSPGRQHDEQGDGARARSAVSNRTNRGHE